MANTTTGPGGDGDGGDGGASNDLIGWLNSMGALDEGSPSAQDRSGDPSAPSGSSGSGKRLRVVAGTSADGDREVPDAGSDAAPGEDAVDGQETDDARDADSPAVDEAPASWEDLLQAVSSPAGSSPSSAESGSAAAAVTSTMRLRPLHGRRRSAARSARASRVSRSGRSSRRAVSLPDRPTPSFASTRPDDDVDSGGGWSRGVKVGAGVVVVLAVAGAVVAGRSFMGGDQTPVAAAPDPSEMTHPASTPAPPPTTSAPVKNKGLPPNDQPVVAGTCPAGGSGGGGELIEPSQKSARSTFAAFQGEYYARNADGVRALISDQDRAWRDQDWPKFLSQIPDGAQWCLTMGPDTGMGSFTATVDQTAGGNTDTFKYQVTAVMGDGHRWFIKHLDAV